LKNSTFRVHFQVFFNKETVQNIPQQMSIVQGRVYGLNLSRKSQINVCPKVNRSVSGTQSTRSASLQQRESESYTKWYITPNDA